jgi:group I intron endonuclease
VYVVYKHTCPNGKVYIGITGISPARRWQRGKNYITNSYFYRAIQKYGWDAIKHEILFDGLSKEEASSKEIELIALYKSNQRDYGYNICSGGEINIPSEETRMRMGNSRRGKKHSTEARLNMSKAAIGKPGTMTGKHHTEEAKKRIAANQQKTVVYQYTRYGKFIATYESVSEASRQTNISREAITGVMSLTNSHKSAKGFIFIKEKFNMTNYYETIINVKKELTKHTNNLAEIKPILEDFNEALADMYKLITAEQIKVNEMLEPVMQEVNKIKALLPKNLEAIHLPTLENTESVVLCPNVSLLAGVENDTFIEKLAAEIMTRINSLNTIIINIKTEEN